MSPVTTPTATATESPPAKSLIMHARVVCKDEETKTTKTVLKIMFLGMPILTTCSLTKVSSTPGSVFQGGDERTLHLIDWCGLGADATKNYIFFVETSPASEQDSFRICLCGICQYVCLQFHPLPQYYGRSIQCDCPIGARCSMGLGRNPLINGLIQHTFKLDFLFVEKFTVIPFD